MTKIRSANYAWEVIISTHVCWDYKTTIGQRVGFLLYYVDISVFGWFIVSPALFSSSSSSREKPISHWCSCSMESDSSTMNITQAPVGMPSGTSALQSSTDSVSATTSVCLTKQSTVEVEYTPVLYM